MTATQRVFRATGMWLARIDGREACAGWHDNPVNPALAFDQAKAYPIDFTQSYQRQPTWSNVQLDGVTIERISPLWPVTSQTQNPTVGGMYVAEPYWKAKLTGVATWPYPGKNAYEYEEVTYDDDANDPRHRLWYHGFHARIATPPVGNTPPLLDIWDAGQGETAEPKHTGISVDFTSAKVIDTGPNSKTTLKPTDPVNKPAAVFLQWDFARQLLLGIPKLPVTLGSRTMVQR